jgi:signal transduction histidine kinase
MASVPRILIVDDEPGVAATLQAILEQEGYQVTTALTAPEAQRLIASHAFNVVLLDVRIDEANGLDLLAELRDRQPDCAAIMLTGYASLESAVRAIRHGAYDYLTKPCDLEELKLTVARAVERATLTRQLRERLKELEQANATIRALNEDLQRRVEAATAELTQKVAELSETTRRLEEAQRLREEFISMVVHEIGQPLTNISGYAQLLERGKVSDEVRERAISTIAGETRRLRRLVQDLADAARLAAGRFQVEPTECDLAEIAREQVELAKARTNRHSITLEAPPNLPPVRCDRDRVAQVLSNLIGNAMKYTPGGRIAVRLRAQNGCVCASVSDEGPGIPPEELGTIFQPYVRLRRSAETETDGSGLGLYIARGIVEAHGGRIWVESTPGKGTTFTFCLPVLQEPPLL